MRRLVRRHLEKLSRQRWRDFCSKLDVRKPLTRFWLVIRRMLRDFQQRHLFRALLYHDNISLKEAAEEYSRLLSTISERQRAPQEPPPKSRLRLAPPLTFLSSYTNSTPQFLVRTNVLHRVKAKKLTRPFLTCPITLDCVY